MALDESKPLRSDRAYAWCGDCEWRNDQPWAHKHARAHGEIMQHVVHIYDPDPECGNLRVLLGQPHECRLPPLHPGDHLDGSVAWAAVL